jgi:hypothetical protein
MTMYDDEEREAIMAEARENVRKRNAEKPRDDVPPSDPIVTWKLDSDRRTAERERMREEISAMSKPLPFNWAIFDERIAQHVAQVLEVERVALAETFGAEIGQLLDHERDAAKEIVRDSFRELEIKVAEMGSKLAEQRTQFVIERHEAQAKQRDEMNALAAEVRELKVENARLGVEIARTRTELAAERVKVIDSSGWPGTGPRRDVN